MQKLDEFLINRVINDVPIFVILIEPANKKIVYANETLMKKVGNIVGQSLDEAFPALNGKVSFTAICEGSEEDCKAVEYYNDNDSSYYYVYEKMIEWLPEQMMICSIMVDVTELKEHQSELAEGHAELAIRNMKLEEISATDSLTKLKNRSKLDEEIQEELDKAERYGKTFSVVLADIDHFKNINDEHGHDFGDQVLVEFAGVIRQNVRKVDIVGRWGGEEFMMILPETDMENAIIAAEKMRRVVEEHDFSIVNKLTASFGVTSYREGDGVKEVFNRVDKRLYRAKEHGRNRVVSED